MRVRWRSRLRRKLTTRSPIILDFSVWCFFLFIDVAVVTYLTPNIINSINIALLTAIDSQQRRRFSHSPFCQLFFEEEEGGDETRTFQQKRTQQHVKLIYLCVELDDRSTRIYRLSAVTTIHTYRVNSKFQLQLIPS